MYIKHIYYNGPLYENPSKINNPKPNSNTSTTNRLTVYQYEVFHESKSSDANFDTGIFT